MVENAQAAEEIRGLLVAKRKAENAGQRGTRSGPIAPRALGGGLSAEERRITMGNVNKVILVGNLGADPELKQIPSGRACCHLRLATTAVFKDASRPAPGEDRMAPGDRLGPGRRAVRPLPQEGP